MNYEQLNGPIVVNKIMGLGTERESDKIVAGKWRIALHFGKNMCKKLKDLLNELYSYNLPFETIE